jgi:hypothetical protein
MNTAGKENSPLIRWIKFSIGLAILAMMIVFFSSGYTPPGILGEVLRHNKACSIDASPLFYSEVENMDELERGVRELIEEKKISEEH